MAKPIKIIVKGSDNRGDDSPTVEDLLSQIQDQVEILREVEEAIAGEGGEQITWRVTNVTKNSPITFEITPYPKVYGTNIEVRAETVVRSTAEGLSSLLTDNARPMHFTDKVLKKVESVNKRVTNGLATTAIDFSNYEEAPNFDLDVTKAQRTITKIAAFKSAVPRPYRELGSVEGFVKTIGRDGFGRPVVSIVTRLDKQNVKCVSKDDGLDKIGHLEVGKVIKGLRIKVHGVMHFKAPGHMDRVEVERVELYPDTSRLPLIADLIDPEFTGGLDSIAYLERIRSDG